LLHQWYAEALRPGSPGFDPGRMPPK
jgi:hypothetical protein